MLTSKWIMNLRQCLKLILSDCFVGQDTAKVVVVGSGPAGLFAALVLAESGAEVTLVERGQPVEGRGKDIGALMVRRLLNAESNLCYGEVSSHEYSLTLLNEVHRPYHQSIMIRKSEN